MEPVPAGQPGGVPDRGTDPGTGGLGTGDPAGGAPFDAPHPVGSAPVGSAPVSPAVSPAADPLGLDDPVITGPEVGQPRVSGPAVEVGGREEWRRRWPPVGYWVRVAVAVTLSLAVLAAARAVQHILVMVVISIVIAVGLDPAVQGLQRLRLSRSMAAAVILLGVVLFVGLFAALLGPPLVRQVTDLAQHIPEYTDQLSKRDDAIGRYFQEHHMAAAVKDFVADLPAKIASSFGTILGVAGRVGAVIFNLVTVATLSIYFLTSLPRLRHSARLLFPRGRREQGEWLLDQAVRRIGGYVSGNLVTSAVCAVVTITALLVIRVPFAVPLGMWAGVADLIPQVGAYLGAAPAVLIGLLDSPVKGIIVLVYFVLYQQFENYLLAPRVMRHAVDLSPAAVIISTLIGGSLLGFAGALLALPIAATVKVVLTELWLRPREEGPTP
jgi:predicted PurR-regulated permease PerM